MFLKTKNWSNNILQAAEFPGINTEGTVEGLTEGKQYEFRVTAKNKAGKSEPSHVTPPVVTKARRGKIYVYWHHLLFQCQGEIWQDVFECL